MKKIIIAAVSLNNVIGLNNKIPWINKEELNHFKNTTIRNVVLMGRNTFKSIGKPLSERTNLVISRSIVEKNNAENVFYFDSINEALKYADKLELDKIFIIGGSGIYSQMINDVDELLISRIPFEFEGDKYFPNISDKYWKLKEIIDFTTFNVEKYIRK